MKGFKARIHNAFAGRLVPGGSVVRPGVDAAGNAQPGIVSITISTNQDAEFSIELSIGLGLNHTVGVAMDTESLSGLPFGICSDTLKAFMTHIVNSEMVPEIANGLQGQLIDPAAAAAKQHDPQHRDFVLTSFILTSDAISFSLCPM